MSGLRLYLDTSVLWTPVWPNRSAAFSRVETLAWRLVRERVSLHVPDVVWRELKNHWRRQVEEDASQASRHLDALKKRVRAPDRLIAPAIGVDALEGDYADAIRELYRRCETVPIAQVSLELLVEMAIAQGGLFERDDKGFRDCVILHSIVEDLAKSEQRLGILVSGDRVFGRPYTFELAQSRGVVLEVVASIDAVVTRLETLLSAEERAQLEYEREHATTVLQWDLPGLSRSIAALLVGTRMDGDEIIRVRQLAVQSIRDVTVPFPDEVSSWIGGAVTFTAEVSADLLIEREQRSIGEVTSPRTTVPWTGTIWCEVDAKMPRTAGNFDPPDGASAVRLLDRRPNAELENSPKR